MYICVKCSATESLSGIVIKQEDSNRDSTTKKLSCVLTFFHDVTEPK